MRQSAAIDSSEIPSYAMDVLDQATRAHASRIENGAERQSNTSETLSVRRRRRWRPSFPRPGRSASLSAPTDGQATRLAERLGEGGKSTLAPKMGAHGSLGHDQARSNGGLLQTERWLSLWRSSGAAQPSHHACLGEVVWRRSMSGLPAADVLTWPCRTISLALSFLP